MPSRQRKLNAWLAGVGGRVVYDRARDSHPGAGIDEEGLGGGRPDRAPSHPNPVDFP